MHPVRSLRNGLATLVLGLAACNNGGNTTCTTCPPPAVTLSVTEASASPSSVLQGDTVHVTGRGTASDGSTPSVAISYLGNVIATSPGTAQAALIPTSGGNGQVVVSKSGSTDATQPYSISYTPLTATGTPSASTLNVGQTLGYALSGPTGTDSLDVRANDGRRFVVPGNSGTAQIPITQAGTLTLTPSAYNGAVNVTGTPSSVTETQPIQNGTLHLLIKEVTNMPLTRTNVTVGTETINIPADTTITRPQGTYAIGIGATQPEAYVYGEMDFNGAWRPLARNYLTHPLTLGAANTATITLISKSQPNFSGAAKVQSDKVYASPFDDSYHPTKAINWQVWLMENPTGVYTSVCAPMDAASKAGAIASIAVMSSEDAAGPDGARRNFTYTAGDPVAAGKLVPNGSTFKPASGVRLLCKQVPGGQSNGTWYDTQGFLDADWIQSAGDANGWLGENKGGTDFVYNGQEGDSLTRNAVHNFTNTRTSMDAFTWNHPLRIAWKAGQNGYDALKIPR